MNINENTIIEGNRERLSRGHIQHCLKNAKIKYHFFGKNASSGRVVIDTKCGIKTAAFEEHNGWIDSFRFI